MDFFVFLLKDVVDLMIFLVKIFVGLELSWFFICIVMKIFKVYIRFFLVLIICNGEFLGLFFLSSVMVNLDCEFDGRIIIVINFWIYEEFYKLG